MPVEKQPKNLVATFIGSGQFSFADGATTAQTGQAAGYRDFGNLKVSSLTSKNEAKEHLGSYNGVRKLDKTVITRTQAGYQVTGDELSLGNLALFLYGSQGASLSQSARTAVAADALTTPVAGKWYDLMIGGVRVRKLTAVAITSSPSVVEDVDYVIDYETGRIRFIAVPTTLTSIVITAPALNSGNAATLKTIIPLTTPIKRGMGRMMIYDSDGILQIDDQDFFCEIYPEGDVGFNDDFADLKINIKTIRPGTFATLNA